MILFEFQTGYFGCSFERSYVWAIGDVRATELFRERFPDRKITAVKALLCASEGEFITALDDEGFSDRIT